MRSNKKMTYHEGYCNNNKITSNNYYIYYSAVLCENPTWAKQGCSLRTVSATSKGSGPTINRAQWKNRLLLTGYVPHKLIFSAWLQHRHYWTYTWSLVGFEQREQVPRHKTGIQSSGLQWCVVESESPEKYNNAYWTKLLVALHELLSNKLSYT